MSSSAKRIAFCGTRGLPANYGGFETAVDEITHRFVDSGYACDVFCRSAGVDDRPASHDGRNLVYVKGSSSRTLDTFVSAIQTGWFLMKNRRRYSHVFWFNNANFPGILMTWLALIPMSVNTDGLEWRRAKWSWPFKLYYIVSSLIISLICRRLISDSYAIQSYYRKKFGAMSRMIPYGTPKPILVTDGEVAATLEQFGLSKNRYFLQITRFEPDNLPLDTARAFVASGLQTHGYQMLLVGFKDQTPYALLVKAMENSPGVLVAKAVYEPKILAALRANCFCYVHGNSVGGTNPALLEAMSGCPRIMAIDCEFSREVLGELGHYFDPKNITPTFQAIIGTPSQSLPLRTRVSDRYQWNAVADAYMQLADGGEGCYLPVTTSSPAKTVVGTEFPQH